MEAYNSSEKSHETVAVNVAQTYELLLPLASPAGDKSANTPLTYHEEYNINSTYSDDYPTSRRLTVSFVDGRNLNICKELNQNRPDGMRWRVTSYEPASEPAVFITRTIHISDRYGINRLGRTKVDAENKYVGYEASTDEDYTHITNMLHEALLLANDLHEYREAA